MASSPNVSLGKRKGRGFWAEIEKRNQKLWVYIWLNLMMGVPSVQFLFLKSHRTWERVAFPVPSVTEIFTVLWGIDSMVVLKEHKPLVTYGMSPMGCHLGPMYRSVTYWRSHCVFTISCSFCIKWGMMYSWLYLIRFFRSTEKKIISVGAFNTEI